jgi:hypothetical protein
VIERRAEQLSKSKHAWLNRLSGRFAASIPVAEAYQRAKKAYWEGRIDEARQYFEEALRQANSAGRSTCVDIIERVNSNLTKVSVLERDRDRVNGVAASCDAKSIRAERDRLSSTGKISFHFMMVEQLDQAAASCQTQADDAVAARDQAGNRDAVCLRDFGPGYVVGHVLEDGRFFCKPTQEAADAWCSNRNGVGHIAVDINERGGFACRPTKETADAWCQSNNSGSGWYAGSIKPDGTYSCHMSEGAQKASAEADCRKKYGGRLIRVYKSKGQYYCEYRRQQVARAKPRRQKRPQPGFDPQAAAAAAAVADAIAQGIQARQRSKGVRQRCHRNPYTGQIHCGAN